MEEFLRKALRRKRGRVPIKPSDRLVLAVQFSVYLIIALVASEIAHLIALESWNSEIFSAITDLGNHLRGLA